MVGVPLGRWEDGMEGTGRFLQQYQVICSNSRGLPWGPENSFDSFYFLNNRVQSDWLKGGGWEEGAGVREKAWNIRLGGGGRAKGQGM